METRSEKIYAKADRNINIEVIPGHFATNHSHVNFYVNMTSLKTHHSMAKLGAAVLAGKFTATPVDTIVCLEGTQVIGAFLAEELSKGPMALSSGDNINVITPETNANNQMIFRKNTQDMVLGRNVLLLLASVSTGKTINRSLECLEYYNANLAGIAALFSATHSIYGKKIESIFSEEEVAGYQTYLPGQCEMCSKKVKLDAIVNSFGHSKL